MLPGIKERPFDRRAGPGGASNSWSDTDLAGLAPLGNGWGRVNHRRECGVGGRHMLAAGSS